MRRVLHAASVVACLAAAILSTGVPRGLLLAAVAAGVGIARTMHAQQSDAPHFDVVSIRRNTSGEQGGKNGLDPGAYTGINVTVRRMIALAYLPLPNAQIVGGPAWINTDRFDVRGTLAGTPSRPQLQEMLRGLLADRFKLRLHTESRPTPVFALTVARAGSLGPDLTRSSLDCSSPVQRPPATADAPSCAFQYTDGRIRGRGVTLDQIAAEIVAGRTVVNRTGLAGFYDVDLRWTPEATQAPADDAPPTLTTALREQLGLRIDAVTVAMDHLVIDAVTRPDEN
jgi:uncharacterized protein (TIGR03435 family)